MIEVPRRQLVTVRGELTQTPRLPDPPEPAVPYGIEGCDRPQGCYNNRQLERMLSLALDWGARMADNLTEIRRLMSEAITNGETPDENDRASLP